MPSDQFVIVLTTLPVEGDAEKFASQLVDERLAACVNILPAMRSVYRWKNAIEKSDERQLIIKTSREMVSGIEGCLSIPGYVGEVDRHVEIVVRAQDRHGNEIRVKPRDWLARVFQHEIDHLEGILFIDRTEDVWKTGEEPEETPGTEDAAGEQEEARI